MEDRVKLNLPVFAKGKVRDIYDCGDALLIVVSDRISAFDVVFSEPIPDKGKVLNQIAAFWFEKTASIVSNHVITTDPMQYPEVTRPHAESLAGRSMLVKKLKMLPVECIVRGYLEGSALRDYKKTGGISGIRLPENMKQADRLEKPIFTPSTKAQTGHDVNINYEEYTELLGSELADQVRDVSLGLYQFAADYARERGIILADTKFEFGMLDGKLVVADEIFTPDSSRFWDLDDYQPGRPQKSFDKQPLRDWLETLDWDKQPPAPPLPQEVIDSTSSRYKLAYEKLTGKPFQ